MIKRVEEISLLIDQNFDLLIDVGADHGYLGITLLQQSKVQQIWNIEISSSALENCKNNYQNFKLMDKASFFLSDGFNKIPSINNDNVLVVISGIGSHKILQILEYLPKNINNLIFLPHTNPFSLRIWAQKHSWEIMSEKYFLFKKTIYIIMKLKKTNTVISFNESELFFGNKYFVNQNFDLCKKYYSNIKDKILNKAFIYRKAQEINFLNLFDKLNK